MLRPRRRTAGCSRSAASRTIQGSGRGRVLAAALGTDTQSTFEHSNNRTCQS